MSTPPITRHPIDAELLDRYLARLTTPAESEQVQRWMASHPDHAIVVGALQTVPLQTDGGDRATDTEAWLARINVQAGSRNVKRLRVAGTPPLRERVWHVCVGAAIGAMLLVAGWTLGGAHRLGHNALPEPIYTAYTTAPGQRATITLPDGSTVALNVASRLEVPTNYNVGNHVVRLPVGEALFTVSHRDGVPFEVVAGVTTARVLGTSFAVRHYQTDTTVTVAVEEGKVAVGVSVVTAGRLVEVGRHGVSSSRPVHAGQFAFVNGVLELPQTRLSDAIPELDRWYDADIRLSDPELGYQQLMGKFPSGSLADLSGLLEATFNGHVVRDGRVLTLSPKGVK